MRTLLVDLDGHGNLSSTALANFDAADASIYDVFHGADPASAVRPVRYAARQLPECFGARAVLSER